ICDPVLDIIQYDLEPAKRSLRLGCQVTVVGALFHDHLRLCTRDVQHRPLNSASRCTCLHRKLNFRRSTISSSTEGTQQGTKSPSRSIIPRFSTASVKSDLRRRKAKFSACSAELSNLPGVAPVYRTDFGCYVCGTSGALHSPRLNISPAVRNPPSTLSVCPQMCLASSEARNT